jgi:hypothetical protein
MERAPLLKPDYKPDTPVFLVIRPAIPSGEMYYFKTESGLSYQVTFGRKKSNYLANIINFSVISDDYEDEYSVTNRGEVWRILNTMIEVIRIYHEKHPFSTSYEFSGEFKEGENEDQPSIRTRLFLRSVEKNVDLAHWKISIEGNRVILKRRKNGKGNSRNKRSFHKI